MMTANDNAQARLLLCGRPKAGAQDGFARWQMRLHQSMLEFPGNHSCEFWPPTPPDQEEWVGVLCFESTDAMRNWRTSEISRALMRDAQPVIEGERLTEIAGGVTAEFYVQNSATEVIVTEVKRGKEQEYRDWASQIDKVESAFPGFRGSYVQPPQEGENVWTTLLRFDTIEKLNAWLNSAERAQLLKESDALVDRVLVHRVDTSFPGWVPPNPITGKSPPGWKTAMLVVLVLFPIVMLEIKFLNPHLRILNSALGTLIGNAISVGLVTWPLMPLAIKGFSWWLYPDEGRAAVNLTGPLAVACGFAIELAVFWRFLG